MTTAERLAGNVRDFARTPRARKLLYWIVGLVAAFAVIGFFVVPPIAKSKAEELLTQQLHRKVTIERIRVNPFAPSATVEGFAVRERDSDTTALGFERLYVNLSWTSLFRLAPIVDEVALARPYALVVRNLDKTYNWQDLIDEALAKPPSDEPPPKFSVNNISITDGRIEFDDRPDKAKHEVTDLRVGIPFISSLPYATDIKVQPALALKADGAPIEIKGETKPFKDTRETTLNIDIDALQLPKYVDYSPVPLRFRLPSGALDTRLVIAFTSLKNTPQSLTVSGDVALSKVEVQQLSGAAVVAVPSLKVTIGLLDVLGNKLDVRSVRIDGLTGNLERTKDGSLNVLSILPPPSTAAAKPAAATPAKPFVFSVTKFEFLNGRLAITDSVPATPYKVGLENITADIEGLGNAPGARATVKASFDTDAKGRAAYAGSVQLEPLAVEGKAEIAGLRLGALYPYYEAALNLEVADGTLDADTQIAVARVGDQLGVKLTALNAAVNKLVLRFPGEKEPLATAPLLAVKDGALDLLKRDVQMGEVAGRDATVWVRRETDGRLLFARLVKTQTDVAAAPRDEAAEAWTYGYRRAALENLTLNFEDRAVTPTVKSQVTRLAVRGENFSNAKGARGTFEIRGIVDKTGSFVVAGPLGVNPIGGNLRVDAKEVSILPFQPYVGDQVNVAITSGAFSAKGQLAFDLPSDAAPKASYIGDVSLTNFASVDTPTSSDLLKWKSLYLSRIDMRLEPLKVAVGEVALTDFYARLIVNPDGTLNLQNLMKKGDGEAKIVAAKQAAPEPAPKPAAKPATPAPAGLPPGISIGRITLAGGNVNFSDFFIRPNYTANLTDVAGTVTTITPEQAGDVDLRAKVDHTAPVEIAGRVNPLAKDLFVDLKASAKDIELPPLSPYAIKYAGYGIQKGKLSMTVKYFIENRKLAAENNIYLDQLTFGDKVESPTATKLPVLLAVALLKDRNGVIDINLPVSGSLDDPQFSVGAIVVQVIVNLIVKAITAPFALLGALVSGGGGEELAYLEFEPGSAALDAADVTKLTSLAKALADRPGLKLDIAGRVDPETDREGLRRASIERQVKAQKFKDAPQGATMPDQVKVDPAEYPRYLTAAYKDAKFPKPRNVIGIAKDLPVAEMETLMLTNAAPTDEDLRLLANARAQAAKDWIIDNGKITADRVFLIAPKLDADGIKDKGKTTRADFSLK